MGVSVLLLLVTSVTSARKLFSSFIQIFHHLCMPGATAMSSSPQCTTLQCSPVISTRVCCGSSAFMDEMTSQLTCSSTQCVHTGHTDPGCVRGNESCWLANPPFSCLHALVVLLMYGLMTLLTVLVLQLCICGLACSCSTCHVWG